MAKSGKIEDQKSQSRRFIETARDLGCDEDDEAAFDEKLKRIATAKPLPKPKNRPKSDKKP
jgi:hypothetical protein